MRKIKNAIAKERNTIKKEFKEKTLGYIIAALGLVAGLSWNEFIQSFIEMFFPIENNNLLAKFLYALITTLIIVIVSVYLLRIFSQRDDETEQ